MTPKHEVDPTTQASMLAPTPAALAMGAVVEVDDAYFQAPTSPAPEPKPQPLTPEQETMKAEADALQFLDLASKSKRNLTNIKKHQRALHAGKVRPGTDIPTELERLENPKNGAIRTAEERHGYFRRSAKAKFGQSIGIETIIETEERATGEFVGEVEVVRSKDPELQAEFTRRYKAFYDQYGQAGSEAAAARTARRQEISERLTPQIAI